MKVIVIGGVAAGPKIASKIIRNCPEADVTVVEKGEFLSYAGCGLPYYISGEVKEQKELMATAVGTVRDSVFFQNVKNVKVLNRTTATKIDKKNNKVVVVDKDGNESSLDYDKLAIATGANPVKPPIPGINLKNIYSLHGVEDAEGIKAKLSEHKAIDAVIVGGGLIGVEVAEAISECGGRVTIVEMLPQILPMLDPEIAVLVEKHFEAKGVRIMTSTKVMGFDGKEEVQKVTTDKETLNADIVILAIGVRPNVELASAIGLEIGKTGAIKVNSKMQTSDPDIYAAGDCVECVNRITGKSCFVPLGSTANKQGRVVANNICGTDDSFPGVIGSSVCKIFDFAAARTGLGEKEAKEAGYDVVTCLAPAPDKAHFMSTMKPLLLKLIADRKTGKLLGAQATGMGIADKRIDVAATAISAGMTVDDVANLDLSYAPPFAPAMDNIITAANVIRNKINGLMVGISSADVKAKIDNNDDCILLDVRSPGEVEQMRIEPCVHIPLGKLRNSLDKLPKDKEIIAFCKISLRGYEAAIILKNAGFENVKVMDGGLLMWPYDKIMK
ncbi:FAD-dependent oxidoreductase [bacterium]|nr:FAD-dependent oxidoreductase [bacterium]